MKLLVLKYELIDKEVDIVIGNVSVRIMKHALRVRERGEGSGEKRAIFFIRLSN